MKPRLSALPPIKHKQRSIFWTLAGFNCILERFCNDVSRIPMINDDIWRKKKYKATHVGRNLGAIWIASTYSHYRELRSAFIELSSLNSISSLIAKTVHREHASVVKLRVTSCWYVQLRAASCWYVPLRAATNGWRWRCVTDSGMQSWENKKNR